MAEKDTQVMTDEQKKSDLNHLSPEQYDKVKEVEGDPVISAAGRRGLEALGIDTNSNNPGGALGVEAAGKYGGFADSTKNPEYKVTTKEQRVEAREDAKKKEEKAPKADKVEVAKVPAK